MTTSMWPIGSGPALIFQLSHVSTFVPPRQSHADTAQLLVLFLFITLLLDVATLEKRVGGLGFLFKIVHHQNWSFHACLAFFLDVYFNTQLPVSTALLVASCTAVECLHLDIDIIKLLMDRVRMITLGRTIVALIIAAET